MKLDINVTENRSPTDESVSLLNEMQKKAFDNVLSHVKLETNNLKDIRWWSYPDQYSFETRIRCRFDLNGDIIEFSFIPKKYIPLSEVGQYILDEITKEISKKIFIDLAKENNVKMITEIYKR